MFSKPLSVLESAQQFAEGQLAFAAHDEVNAASLVHVGIGGETGIVAAHHDAHSGLQRAHQFDHAKGRLALEGHDRQADDVGVDVRASAARWSARTLCCTRIRSATATLWWGSTLPASEVRPPLGMRTATVGMCSNESGMASRSTFTTRLLRVFPSAPQRPECINGTPKSR